MKAVPPVKSARTPPLACSFANVSANSKIAASVVVAERTSARLFTIVPAANRKS